MLILNAAVISLWVFQTIMFIRNYSRFLKAEKIAAQIIKSKK